MNDLRNFIQIIEGTLNEALPLKTAKRFMKNNYKSTEYDSMFNSFAKYGRNKPRLQRLYFPLRVKGSTSTPIILNSDSACIQVYSFFKYQYSIKSLFSSYHVEGGAGGVIGQFVSKNSQISATLKKVEELLLPSYKPDNMFITDYKAGLINTHKRKIKIGKLLQDCLKSAEIVHAYALDALNKFDLENNPDQISQWRDTSSTERDADYFIKNTKFLIEKFQNDPMRAMKAPISYYVVISRSPYDIAGMSTDRGWTSCTNLESGSQRIYVRSYVENSNLIAYLIKEGDWDIKAPISRQLLCRFNSEDSDDYVIWPMETYGTNSAAFDRTTKLFCKIVNRGKDDGMYEVKDNQQYIGTVDKEGHNIDGADTLDNNRRHDNVHYDEDGEGHEDEDGNENDNVEIRRLRRDYDRDGVTEGTLNQLRNLSIDYYDQFELSDNDQTVTIQTYSNFEKFIDDTNDDLVKSINDLYIDAVDLELDSEILDKILSNHVVYDIINHLPTDTYRKLLNDLKVKVVEHNDPDYHRSLVTAVKKMKDSHYWEDIKEAVSNTVPKDRQFKEFLHDRLKEYIDYGWRYDNYHLYASINENDLLKPVRVQVSTSDLFALVIDQHNEDSEYGYLISRGYDMYDDNDYERKNEYPNRIYAKLPDKLKQKTLFDDGDDDKSEKGFKFGKGHSYEDDPAIKAYLENIPIDAANVADTLAKLIK